MKIKAIEAICKQHKHIRLYNTGRQQWISAGSAAYPINFLPAMNEDYLLAILDVPEDKRSKYFVEFGDTLPAAYSFFDTAVGETLLEQYPIEVSVYGGIVVPLVTSLGMVFINKDYLKPFKDIKRGVDLYERINDAGELYIAVKDGFMLCGLILPLDIINKEFSDSLCKLAELTRVSFENKKTNERDGQINITEVLELDEEQ